MRKIREVLRLHYEKGFSQCNIARSISIARSTVQEYVRRAMRCDLGWPLPQELDDASLEELLYPPQPNENVVRPIPDFSDVHKELKRKGVTLYLLWEEYEEGCPAAYGYSRFCELYRKYTKECDLSMTQHHKGGEKLFIDYSGLMMPIWNSDGTTNDAEIFVATMGASSHSYVEATESQQLKDWITSHVHTFEYMSGVPEILVPDNLKGGVHKSHRYEPDLNPTYAEMAAYYGIAVIPARVRTPKDKSKVEKAVQDVERQILAPLRKRKFFSLDELNREIRKRLKEFNEKPFQKMPGSRLSHFEELDRPYLKPLPPIRYEYADWEKKLACKSYHINVLGHQYSVPYHYTQAKVDVRITARIVEVMCKGKRIASHKRSFRGVWHDLFLNSGINK